jgi:hypothetical protein
MKHFDESKWRNYAQHADWYIRIKPDYDRLTEQTKADPDSADEIKEEVRGFFEELIRTGEIALGSKMPELDAERKPIDTAVIHHTSQPAGLSLERLSVIHLLNIYAPYFANPTSPHDQHLKGKPITSNHFYKDEVTFSGYHWLVRMDGSTTRIIQDDEIGWHAGDWDVNCRSVGICLDNDYETTAPSEVVLEAVAGLLKEHYPQISATKILGHCEVNKKTVCPGNKFLDSWKPKLLAHLSADDLQQAA